MDDCTIDTQLMVYNNLVKETEELYRRAAKTLGLSECAFWILYELRTNHTPLTQRDICYALHQPKQTVNSALKKLEAGGLIQLLYTQDRRSKQIQLTPKGVALAEKTVDQVITAEKRTFSCLSAEKRTAFLGLFRTYTDLLTDAFEQDIQPFLTEL